MEGNFNGYVVKKDSKPEDDIEFIEGHALVTDGLIALQPLNNFSKCKFDKGDTITIVIKS